MCDQRHSCDPVPEHGLRNENGPALKPGHYLLRRISALDLLLDDGLVAAVLDHRLGARCTVVTGMTPTPAHATIAVTDDDAASIDVAAWLVQSHAA